MKTPKLYIFSISHYCEKARWALDLLGIHYTLKVLAPGVHAKFAEKNGLNASTVPILEHDGNFLQGSSAIIQWAESNANRIGNKTAAFKTLSPVSDTDRALCSEIEHRADDILGVHIRRFYYSEALIEYPETVRPLFTEKLPFLLKLIISWKWPVITKIMIKRLDLGKQQGLNSREIIEKELNWLDGLLKDGKDYLVGNQLSRADITVASLLSPIILPHNHPVYGNMSLPPKMQAYVETQLDRPALKWLEKIYQNHR